MITDFKTDILQQDFISTYVFLQKGLANAVLPSLDNHACLIMCMKDTPLGIRFEDATRNCKKNECNRSIESDKNIEEKTHCATYWHIQHYIHEVSNGLIFIYSEYINSNAIIY